MEILKSPSRFSRVWYFVDLDRENKMPDEPPSPNARHRTHDQHRCCICPPQSNWGGPTADPNLDCSSGHRQPRQTGTRKRGRADTRRPDPSIGSPGLRRLLGMRLARPNAQATCHDRTWTYCGAVSRSLEPPPGASNHRAQLFGTTVQSGKTDWPWAGA